MKLFNIIATTLVVLLTSFGGVSAQETQPTPKTHPSIPTIQAGAKWHLLRRDIYIVDKPNDTSTALERHVTFNASTETFELDKIKEVDGKSYFDIGKHQFRENLYVREDLDKGKIYLRCNFRDANKVDGQPAEVVLFDYNYKVGDTVRVYSGYDNDERLSLDYEQGALGWMRPMLLRVIDIRTREMLGANRIVYTLERVLLASDKPRSSLEVYQWIEGIGYSFGFLFNKEELGLVPGFTYLDYTPLCYTSPTGDVYKFHPSELCEIKQTRGTTAPLTRESLDVQIERDQLGLTIRVNDDKHHDLTVYRSDGTTLVGTTSFYESYALAKFGYEGEKIFVVVDDETIPYIL